MATQAEVEALYGPHVATLAIPAANVDETATDFPVYLDLSLMPSTFWDAVRAGDGTADSLRVFVNNAGNYVEKPREIVSADSTSGSESGEVHFLTDTVAGQDAEVILYADGTSADYAVDGTFGRNAVWANYLGIWHNGGSYNSVDGSDPGTLLDAVVQGDTDAPTGVGTRYNNNDTVNTGVTIPFLSLSDNYVMSLWYKDEGDSKSVIGNRFEGTASPLQFFKFRDSQASYYNGGVDGRIASGINNGDPFSNIIVLKGGSTLYLYKDGVLLNSGALSKTMDSNPFYIGGGSGVFLNEATVGVISEVRAGLLELSSNWIAQEYANQSDPSTFYTIAANAAPVGVVNVYLGTGAIDKLYLGATEITKAYLGATVIYEAT